MYIFTSNSSTKHCWTPMSDFHISIYSLINSPTMVYPPCLMLLNGEEQLSTNKNGSYTFEPL